jgi:hypothetical protein
MTTKPVRNERLTRNAEGEPVKILTEDADLRCDHMNGKVKVQATQALVTVDGRRVLVDDNPESRPISGCPMYGAMIKPCANTLAVKKGYSDLVTIDGKRVCLDTVEGLTDGTPPGTVKYKVVEPGQAWVDQA